MKIPLDYLCVKTGVLCPRCQRLVDTGVVGDYEVDVMRALLDLEERPDFKFLKTAKYVKTLRLDGMYVLILETKDPNLRPRDLGRLGRALSDKLRVRTRVINKVGGDIRELAKQLMYPARVTGVNTLWLPDGSIEHIVRVPKADLRYLPMKTTSLEEILSQITGMNVRIRIEY
ncbi:MAG: transcription elongation factor [Desulfurococcales archaeon]|nr:transcription elongation factor [Desulfurococcales archaeon]